jgi:hypothetical protein
MVEILIWFFVIWLGGLMIGAMIMLTCAMLSILHDAYCDARTRFTVWRYFRGIE